jgi:hypothetical protein
MSLADNNFFDQRHKSIELPEYLLYTYIHGKFTNTDVISIADLKEQLPVP